MPSSPCSVPDWLRWLIPFETPAQQEACRWHDEQYALGGPRAARLSVDLDFTRRLLEAGMAPDQAERYLWAVRQYGGAHWTGGDAPGAAPLHAPDPDPVNAP